MNINIKEIHERIEFIRNGLDDNSISIDQRPRLRKELDILERKYCVQLYLYQQSINSNVESISNNDSEDLGSVCKVQKPFSQDRQNYINLAYKERCESCSRPLDCCICGR